MCLINNQINLVKQFKFIYNEKVCFNRSDTAMRFNNKC
jgi:hypothetical protein